MVELGLLVLFLIVGVVVTKLTNDHDDDNNNLPMTFNSDF